MLGRKLTPKQSDNTVVYYLSPFSGLSKVSWCTSASVGLSGVSDEVAFTRAFNRGCETQRGSPHVLWTSSRGAGNVAGCALLLQVVQHLSQQSRTLRLKLAPSAFSRARLRTHSYLFLLPLVRKSKSYRQPRCKEEIQASSFNGMDIRK